MFGPVRCLVVFSGSCRSSIAITLLGKRKLVAFLFLRFFGLCTVCLGLFPFLEVSLNAPYSSKIDILLSKKGLIN